jgi:plastocyanin
MYNKFIIAIAVIIIGVVAGWYVVGGKGNIPKFPQQITSPATVINPTVAPTAEAANLYQYREVSITGTPQPTGGNLTTKGGMTNPVVSVKPTSIQAVLQKKSAVSYTNEGFSPGVLTVKVGTSVVFTNNSNTSMWVASAVHPTHQELPGFDQLKSVSNSGTYEYVFTKVGTWKYHNHMLPDDTGVVIVTQ